MARPPLVFLLILAVGCSRDSQSTQHVADQDLIKLQQSSLEQRPANTKTGLDWAAVEAWRKQGFEVGSMGGTVARLSFSSDHPERLRGPVPAFGTSKPGEVRVTALPPINVPFGLDLSYSNLTEEGLRVFAGLKNLTMLSLQKTQVTDSGLKELARVSKLTALYVTSPNVTASGLKQLADLPAYNGPQKLDSRIS